MKRSSVVVGTSILVAFSALFVGGLGPLDPPSGPVMESGPSLADLETKINDLSLAVTDRVRDQYRDVQVLYIEAGEPSQTEAIQITTGPTRVLGIAGYLSQAVVFDGPGAFNGSARGAADGDVLGRLSFEQVQVIGSGRGQSFIHRSSNGFSLNTVAENGLYLAHSVSGHLLVYYEEIK